MSKLDRAGQTMESVGGKLFMRLFVGVMLMVIAALLATMQMTAVAGVHAAAHAEGTAESAVTVNVDQEKRLSIAEVRIADERAKTAAVVSMLQALTLQVTQHGDAIGANKEAIRRNHGGS